MAHHKRHLFVLALSLFEAMTVFPAPLFDGGKSDWSVVVPDGAERPLWYASSELTNTIKKISGAVIPVERASDASRRPAIRLVVNGDADIETFYVKCANESVVLSGSSPRAVLFAVYAFLRDRLGARWYWPGESGEFLPRLDRFDVEPWEKTYSPAFPLREMSICDAPGHRHAPTERWFAKIFLNSGINSPDVQRDLGFVRVLGGHFVALPCGDRGKRLFAEHPDWYSQINGKRDIRGYAGCWSNKGFFDYTVSNLVSLIRSQKADVANLFVADITPRCECEGCTANPDRSARWWNYYGRLTDAIRREIPGQRFAGLAYMEYRSVPGTPVRNLEYVEYGHYNRCYFHALGDSKCPLNAKSMDEFRRWGEKAPLGLYGYEFDVFRMNMSLPIWRILSDEMRVFRDMGLRRVKTEYACDIPLMAAKKLSKSEVRQYANRLSLYAWAAFAFDPDLDPAALVKDFCDHVYGEASSVMLKYHKTLAWYWSAMPNHVTYFYSSPRDHVRRFLPQERIETLRSLLAEAAAAAKDDARASAEVALETGFFSRWAGLAEDARKLGVVCDVAKRGSDDAFDSVGWGRMSSRSGKAFQPTRLKVYHSAKSLNILVECDEKRSGLDRGTTEKDKPDFNWDNASVEIFIETGDGACRQIAVTPAGGVWDAKDGDIAWDSGAKVFPTSGDGLWRLAVTLPFENLGGAPKSGDKWKCMVIRNEPKGSKFASCGWPVNAHRDFSAAATLAFN